MRDTIVFDTPNQAFYGNRVFDPEYAQNYPGAMVAVKFRELAESEGYRVITCDLVEAQGISPRRTILWTEQWSSYTAKLVLRGALPALVCSAETLWHAWSFYSRLYKISSLYEHTFVFEGVRDHVNHNSTIFHRAYFPQSLNRRLFQEESSLKGRRLLVMINSNLKPPGGWKYSYACLTEPRLRNDLYRERLRAIEFFSQVEGFDLYGRGWGKLSPWLSEREVTSVGQSFRVECVDKIETLSRYRFALCFENTMFEGYITEKMFDCFFAGCIPVYRGAPDIARYVPDNTFIDARNFNDYRDLSSFLSRMTRTEERRYHDAIDRFLESEKFRPFYYDNVAHSYLDAIKDCVAREGKKEPLNFSRRTGLRIVDVREQLKSYVRSASASLQ